MPGGGVGVGVGVAPGEEVGVGVELGVSVAVGLVVGVPPCTIKDFVLEVLLFCRVIVSEVHLESPKLTLPVSGSKLIVGYGEVNGGAAGQLEPPDPDTDCVIFAASCNVL